MYGITSTKVKHKDGSDTITGETHSLSPYLFFGETQQSLKLTEYLWTLGETTVVTAAEPFQWNPTTLQDIVLDVHANGSKADIYIGTFSLADGEQFIIDPATDTWQVGASTDDTRVADTSASLPHHPNWLSINNTVNPLLAGGVISDSTQYWFGAGMRFETTVPEAATTSSAYLKVTAEDTKSDATVNTRITCEDAADPATFSTLGDYNARPQTSAFAEWDGIGAWTLNTEYTSPNIGGASSPVQEAVDVSGFTGDIVVFWDDHGSSAGSGIYRPAWSYDGSTSKAPKLEVTWTVAGGLSIPVAMRTTIRTGMSSKKPAAPSSLPIGI